MWARTPPLRQPSNTRVDSSPQAPIQRDKPHTERTKSLPDHPPQRRRPIARLVPIDNAAGNAYCKKSNFGQRSSQPVILRCLVLLQGSYWTWFEFVFTPKHGSWLNVAECELSAMTRQGLAGRRIGELSERQEESSTPTEYIQAALQLLDADFAWARCQCVRCVSVSCCSPPLILE